MDIKDVCEQAYKNGYNDGVREFAKELYNTFRQYENYDRFHTFEILDRIETVEEQLTKR